MPAWYKKKRRSRKRRRRERGNEGLIMLGGAQNNGSEHLELQEPTQPKPPPGWKPPLVAPPVTEIVKGTPVGKPFKSGPLVDIGPSHASGSPYIPSPDWDKYLKIKFDSYRNEKYGQDSMFNNQWYFDDWYHNHYKGPKPVFGGKTSWDRLPQKLLDEIYPGGLKTEDYEKKHVWTTYPIPTPDKIITKQQLQQILPPVKSSEGTRARGKDFNVNPEKYMKFIPHYKVGFYKSKESRAETFKAAAAVAATLAAAYGGYRLVRWAAWLRNLVKYHQAPGKGITNLGGKADLLQLKNKGKDELLEVLVEKPGQAIKEMTPKKMLPDAYQKMLNDIANVVEKEASPVKSRYPKRQGGLFTKDLYKETSKLQLASKKKKP